MTKIGFKNLACLFLASYSLQIHAAPDTEGSWTPVVDWPLIAIHSVLTPQGNVLSFGTDKNGVQGAQFIYDVWDPLKGVGASAHNTLPNTLGVDSFCSAAVVMPESGSILIAGGDNRPNGVTNAGINDAPIFNPATGALSRAQNMASARWYATSTVLPNGEILLNGGKDGAIRDVHTPEIYSPATNTWRSLFGISTEGYSSTYPRQWVTANGKLFGIEARGAMFWLDPTGNGSIEFLEDVPVTDALWSVYKSTSVMYQPGKILYVVGESRDHTADTWIIDVNGSNPVIREVSQPAEKGRVWATSVVLPDGKVMLVGGLDSWNDIYSTVGASFRPEIWDPATEAWSLMAPAATMRLYHSTALLLKDGRVLVAGGGAPGPQNNTNAEIFSPPYLFNRDGLAPRPSVISAPKEAPYDSRVPVEHGPNDKITRVTLIKTGAVTHSFDMEQRFLELDFTDTQTGIEVRLPNSPNLATPGNYLMYLINDKGVPSVGHIIRISSTAVMQLPYPVANAESVNVTNNGSALSINVLNNDSGTGLTISDYNRYSEKGGTISQSGRALVYRPKAGFNGVDTFWYVIKDSLGRTNSAKVTLNVSGGTTSNPAPVGNTDTASVAAGSTAILDVLANDTGTGLVLSAPSSEWSSKGGKVSLSNNQLRYTAPTGFNGEDKVWYTFTDSQGRGNWSVVTINVSGGTVSNPPPVGVQDTARVNAGSTTLLDVLANDIGNGLVLNAPNSEWSSKGGRVSLSNNQIRYVAPTNFNGQDQIWYTFKDVEGRNNWSSVTITVQGGTVSAPPPVGNPDNVSANQGATITIDVLANDIGSGLVINPISAWSQKGGRVSIVSNKLRYTAPSSFTGQDKIWYSFKDSQGRENYGEVTINVN